MKIKKSYQESLKNDMKQNLQGMNNQKVFEPKKIADLKKFRPDISLDKKLDIVNQSGI